MAGRLVTVIAIVMTAAVFVAGVPVALGWIRQAIPLLLYLLVPVLGLSLALGLWKRRW